MQSNPTSYQIQIRTRQCIQCRATYISLEQGWKQQLISLFLIKLNNCSILYCRTWTLSSFQDSIRVLVYNFILQTTLFWASIHTRKSQKQQGSLSATYCQSFPAIQACHLEIFFCSCILVSPWSSLLWQPAIFQNPFRNCQNCCLCFPIDWKKNFEAMLFTKI